MSYGDYANVTKDAQVLIDIFNRQGAGIMLEVIADRVAESNARYKWTDAELCKVIRSYTKELQELILERT